MQEIRQEVKLTDYGKITGGKTEAITRMELYSY